MYKETPENLKAENMKLRDFVLRISDWLRSLETESTNKAKMSRSKSNSLAEGYLAHARFYASLIKQAEDALKRGVSQ